MTITMEKRAVVTPADHIPGPEQGNWTYNHYAALPDDGHRYEIVGGVLYMTPAPSISHQKTAQRIFRALAALVEDTGLGQVFIAPVDVELSASFVVQPDVFVLLNHEKHKITPSRVIGAPSLIVEVSSPSTIGYDRRHKQDAYARAGVAEYWIAHPGEKTIEVLALEGGEYYTLGVFSKQDTLVSQIVPSIAEIPAEKFFL